MTGPRRQVRHLGLTGGIGSGKSTVAKLLSAHGAGVIDADAVARQLTQPGGAAMPEIEARFGSGVVNADGALDRDAMRALVFSQPDARARLEAIIHPLVGQNLQAEALAHEAAGAPLVVYDIPLLVESKRWPAELDGVLVVDCLPETQISRVQQRNGLSREAVLAIMAAQASREQRLACADAVIVNEGCTLEALGLQVADLAHYFGL